MSRAFQDAERARRRGRGAPSPAKLRYIAHLCREAGVERPEVHFATEADEVIDNLKAHLARMRQPQLEGVA